MSDDDGTGRQVDDLIVTWSVSALAITTVAHATRPGHQLTFCWRMLPPAFRLATESDARCGECSRTLAAHARHRGVVAVDGGSDGLQRRSERLSEV